MEIRIGKCGNGHEAKWECFISLGLWYWIHNIHLCVKVLKLNTKKKKKIGIVDI